MVKILLALIVVANGIFAFRFFSDFVKHKADAFKENGSNALLAVWGFIVFFLSTFGISDFALSTVFYRLRKLVDDTKLPGTLNTQCAIPVAVMALAYISTISVDQTTLILLIISQMVGAYFGPRFVVKMPVKQIRAFMGFGLLTAAFFVLAGKFGILPSGGEAVGLSGWKLILGMALLLVYGALNNLGVGSYAPTMATVYALGLNPAIAFPVMMGACTFSVPLGAMEFVRLDKYGRKITFFCSVFGTLGVLASVFIVKSLDTAMLQWVVAAVIMIAAIDLIHSVFKSSKA